MHPHHVKLRRISRDFEENVAKDLAKQLLLPVKYILEGVSLFPNNDGVLQSILNGALFLSWFLMLLGQIFYLIIDGSTITDYITVAITAATTFEACIKAFNIIRNKNTFNELLVILQEQFWLTDMVSPKYYREIKIRIYNIYFAGCVLLFVGFISCAQINSTNLILGIGKLPFLSHFPLSFYEAPIFEILTIWQWLNNYACVFFIFGYDVFFWVYSMNVVIQFLILQDVLRNLYEVKDESYFAKYYSIGILREDLNGGTAKMLLLAKCIQHHQLLLNICEKLEDTFSLVILLQFIESSVAICGSSYIGMYATENIYVMFLFAFAHVVQLFVLCSIGNEFIEQSKGVGDAAYECGWEKEYDSDVRKCLVLIILRSQRHQQLTAHHFVEMSFRSFVMVMRASFSLYTLLHNVFNKE